MTSVAPRQSGPHVWTSSDFDDASWMWKLSNQHIDEVVAASAPYVNHTENELASLTAGAFPLPTLSSRLVELRARLTAGRGFELIRGFPAHELPERQSAAAFAGVGAHVGSLRSQNAQGDLLGHVRNVGLDAQDPNVRIYQTNERQTFHTDSADVVGLLCLETAADGGESLLVSVATIYNEMLDRAPELAALLFELIATDRRGEVPAGAAPFFGIPVLNWYAGELTVVYQRQYIDSAQRFEDAPRVTDEVEAALDLFDDLSNQPEFQVRMKLEVGDMQFVHNHSLLHDRTGFVDKPGSPRHLLRLWLSVPGDRQLPAVFAERFGSVTVGDRGGITATAG